MEIFLYDWWPIRAEATLADRLSVMPVRISYKQNARADGGREIGRLPHQRLEPSEAYERKFAKALAASVGACLCYHLTIGRGLSGCFHHRSIVSSTSRR